MNSQLVEQNTEAGILARLIEPTDLSHDAANFLLSLQFNARDVSRMNELSESAQIGALSPADAAELDSYIHVSDLLAAIQSKARRSLRGLKS